MISNPSDARAATVSPTAACSTAVRNTGSLAGVGFVFAANDQYCGVDLDDSVDPDSGQLKGWAGDIVERLDS